MREIHVATSFLYGKGPHLEQRVSQTGDKQNKGSHGKGKKNQIMREDRIQKTGQRDGAKEEQEKK